MVVLPSALINGPNSFARLVNRSVSNCGASKVLGPSGKTHRNTPPTVPWVVRNKEESAPICPSALSTGWILDAGVFGG